MELATAAAPKLTNARVLMLVMPVVALLLIFVLDAARSPDERGQAVVTGLGPGPDRISVAVRVGPDTNRWEMIWHGDVEPGDLVDVELRGGCGCEPAQPDEGSIVDIQTVVLCLFCIVVAGWGLPRDRARRIAVDASHRALLASGQPVPVRIERHWFQARFRRPGFAWSVHDARSDEGLLGWLGMTLASAEMAVDVTEPLSMFGGPEPGAAVGLLSADRHRVYLPVTPLLATPGRGAVVHPQSGAINRLLGLAPTGPMPELGSTAHVRVADLPAAPAGRTLVEAAQRSGLRDAWVNLSMLIVFVATLGATFMDWIPLVSIALVVSGLYIIRVLTVPWKARPLTRALEDERGLDGRDATFVARALLFAGITLMRPAMDWSAAPANR